MTDPLKAWPDESIERLTVLCRAKASTPEILAAFPEYSRSAVIAKWNRLGFARREFARQRVYKNRPRKKYCRGWSQEDVEKLISLRQMQPGTNRPVAFDTIGKMMGRDGSTIRAKWNQIQRGYSPGLVSFPVERPAYIPPRVIAERNFAFDNDCRDSTGFLCGDPLPGRSALAKREARP